MVRPLEDAIRVFRAAAECGECLRDSPSEGIDADVECLREIAEAVATIWNSHLDYNAAKVGSEPLDFGKYAGTAIDQVPLGYLDALVGNSAQNDRIRGYLQSEAVREERKKLRARFPNHRVNLHRLERRDQPET